MFNKIGSPGKTVINEVPTRIFPLETSFLTVISRVTLEPWGYLQGNPENLFFDY
jgi:ABC-type Fe3+-citrate transport system substrate-binding protein